ncbi:hypothetical protein FZC83_02225 [Rossellomorea marisflavi]|uniref:DEAD/DEAH-box helicase domain-containing protein n=1 Tax=Rossellomorea marisflavi TaxID=189381 RepID=A0A5D4RYE6_9BACI|nr:DEAD/DEAH box helicase family protein [Rossellomorea marisflavi]TYS56413.1 hypothetical protein FZC83_02225 [Rossellomorea marisflavi]
MSNEQTDQRINDLFSTLPHSHARNINREAFDDIGKVLLSFHDRSNHSDIREVCAASMGHGKSTVLISYLKWITKQSRKQPVLIATREKHLANEIYKEISKVNQKSIININADNKAMYEDDLHKYQIVIIQHSRLKNLALGYGNKTKYSMYGKGKKVTERLLIIDEKPDFYDSAIFDINNHHNVLEWFEDLAEPLEKTPVQLQRIKSYIIFLLSNQLSENYTDVTTSLLTGYSETIATKNMNTLLNEMGKHLSNLHKFDSLNKMKHFKNLLHEDGYGRIDDYNYKKQGRKIIVSKIVDYSLLGMNYLIFDGTCIANAIQYTKVGINKVHSLPNRNDYSRLTYQIDEINTTKYSRSKKGESVQSTITKRIKELRKQHKDIFILPMKDEISTYIAEGAILPEDEHSYIDNPTHNVKGINLLNTVGKNVLKDKKALYLTSLPKKNADYYKCIAIALFHDEVNLMMNDETNNYNWFRDDRLEQVYRGDLYAELLQIIHRTALRKINGNDHITIYVAYNEDAEKHTQESYTYVPIGLNLNSKFFKKKANLPEPHRLVNMKSYGRDKKMEEFANQVKSSLKKNKLESITVNKVSSSFSNYVRSHWKKQRENITLELEAHGVMIYVDELDKRKSKKVKLI